MNGNEVRYSVLEIEEPAWAARAADFALAALDELGKRNWLVSLVLCGDGMIHKLNRDYRRIDAPTDVLSFTLGEYEPVEEGKSAEPVYIAGDIVISVPAMERNSSEFHVSPDEELRRLIVHGLLHLSGMDHADNSPEQPMLLQQEDLVRRLGGSIIL